MAKAIWINARARTLEFLELKDLKGMQTAVDGIVDNIGPLGRDNYLFACGDGRYNGIDHGFRFQSLDIFGNGFIIGLGRNGKLINVKGSLKDIEPHVEWLNFAGVTVLPTIRTRRLAY